jgi:hypothetical protein
MALIIITIIIIPCIKEMMMMLMMIIIIMIIIHCNNNFDGKYWLYVSQNCPDRHPGYPDWRGTPALAVRSSSVAVTACSKCARAVPKLTRKS